MNRKGYISLGEIIGLYLLIFGLFLMNPSDDYYDFFIRFFALTGLY